VISDDVLSQIVAVAPNLSAQDIEDLRTCDPTQIARLMRTYQNAGKIADRGIWVKLATILQQVAAYAPLASTILTVVDAL
jgi:hypothetical protein